MRAGKSAAWRKKSTSKKEQRKNNSGGGGIRLNKRGSKIQKISATKRLTFSPVNSYVGVTPVVDEYSQYIGLLGGDKGQRRQSGAKG